MAILDYSNFGTPFHTTLLGLTIYIKTNRGRSYSCRPRGLDVHHDGSATLEVESFRGGYNNGTYDGKVALGTTELAMLREAYGSSR